MELVIGDYYIESWNIDRTEKHIVRIDAIKRSRIFFTVVNNSNHRSYYNYSMKYFINTHIHYKVYNTPLYKALNE